MKQPKYVKIAAEIEQAIRDLTLQPGARLPSVRKLMAQQQVSLATVTAALNRLEEAGLVEPRAKSGYYVRKIATDTQAPGAPATSDPTAPPGAPAPDLYPAERLKRIAASLVRRHPDLAARPPRDAGQTALATQIVRRSAEFGCYLREDEVVLTQGDTEALSLALRALLRRGDRVLVQAPLDPWARGVLEALGMEPEPIRETGGEFVATVKRRLENGSEAKALLANPSFHFPSGEIMPIAAKRELLRVCTRFDLPLIEDDRFGDLQHEGTRPLPIKSFDTEGIVVYLSSCCRSIAPGLQIGWLAAASARLDTIRSLKRASSSTVSELNQRILAEFLSRGSHTPHLRKLRERLRERTEAARAALEAGWGDTPTKPVTGGYTYWLPLVSSPDDDERQSLQARYPALFAAGSRVLDFVDGGLCINASHPLDERSLQALAGCARQLQAHVAAFAPR